MLCRGAKIGVVTTQRRPPGCSAQECADEVATTIVYYYGLGTAACAAARQAATHATATSAVAGDEQEPGKLKMAALKECLARARQADKQGRRRGAGDGHGRTVDRHSKEYFGSTHENAARVPWAVAYEDGNCSTMS